MDRFKKILAVFVLTLGLCLYSLPTYALMLKIELPDLVRDSELILTGRVEDMDSRFEDKERGIIYTYVTIIPEEIIKGELSQPEVVVRIPGGEVGDLGLKVSDVPEFEFDERVLVFLKTDTKARGYFKLNGLFQGKFTVLDDNTLRENAQPLEGFIQKIRSHINNNKK